MQTYERSTIAKLFFKHAMETPEILICLKVKIRKRYGNHCNFHNSDIKIRQCIVNQADVNNSEIRVRKHNEHKLRFEHAMKINVF